jgi:hypothetical protein
VRSVLVGLMAVLVAGCEPHMTVTATPRVICAGTTLTVEWQGRGQVVEVT